MIATPIAVEVELRRLIALYADAAALAVMAQRHWAEWNEHKTVVRAAISKKDLYEAERTRTGAETIRALQYDERTRLIAQQSGVQGAIRERGQNIVTAMPIVSGMNRLSPLERVQAVQKLVREFSDVITLERWLFGIDQVGAGAGEFK
jgi:hypothetical protein